MKGGEEMHERRKQKLGFSDLGVIPRAVENADGTYQDAFIMFCSLT